MTLEYREDPDHGAKVFFPLVISSPFIRIQVHFSLEGVSLRGLYVCRRRVCLSCLSATAGLTDLHQVSLLQFIVGMVVKKEEPRNQHN